MESRACASVAGHGVQSSKHMAMSERQRALHVHGILGRQVHLVAIDGRTEAHALFRDLAQLGQAEHLEATRVGEDGALPVHEPVQSAMRADHFRARAQHQVEGVAEDDLRADGFQFLGRHGLDRAVGAHGHEGRRLDHAAIQREPATARRALGAQQFVCDHARAPGRGADEHRVAVTEEAVALAHRMGIGGQHLLAPGKGRRPASAASIPAGGNW